ncbi:hypothetical protein BV898_15256 [Hypsibius exemplaris]|uniref:G-protein coupled receptors family 1 profile domain-containing protein n=1 Tax=Hypsibius exemplaris TaxID=2072580 RepID=A0A9X6RK87_HYPEX|nr:hypothetical protein BV898_15256 [Hypsibius exemplaris]
MNNTSTLETRGHFTRSVVSAILLIPVGVVGAVVCLTTILAVRKQNRGSSVDAFFISINVYVLILSGFFCPLAAYSTLAGHVNLLTTDRFQPLCRTLAFAYIVTIQTDAFTHAAVAVHRFFAVILQNTTYQRVQWFRSKQCTTILVLIPWLISLLIGVWPLFHLGAEFGYGLYYTRCGTVKILALSYYQFLRSFFFFFSCALIAICYMAIFCKLIVSRGTVHVRPTVGTAKMRREVALTKVAFGLTFVFLVLLLPSVVHALTAKTPAEVYTTLGDVFLMMLELGCVLNPWMIVFLTPALRETCTNCLMRRAPPSVPGANGISLQRTASGTRQSKRNPTAY